MPTRSPPTPVVNVWPTACARSTLRFPSETRFAWSTTTVHALVARTETTAATAQTAATSRRQGMVYRAIRPPRARLRRPQYPGREIGWHGVPLEGGYRSQATGGVGIRPVRAEGGATRILGRFRGARACGHSVTDAEEP